jgi:hypothetical protein
MFITPVTHLVTANQFTWSPLPAITLFITSLVTTCGESDRLIGKKQRRTLVLAGVSCTCYSRHMCERYGERQGESEREEEEMEGV